MKAVLSNRIYLYNTKALEEKIRQELTYAIPPTFSGGKVEHIINYIKMRSDLITIPAGRADLIPDNYTIIDKRVDTKVDFPPLNPNIVLREDQQRAVDSATSNYIIVAKPAWGKTFTGVALIHKIGNKALILVHTSYLMKQWVEQIKKSLGIQAGTIGDSEKKKLDSPIIVGMVQTVHKMNLKKELPSIGTLVVDEAHHVAASTFKSIVNNCSAKYKIGLTATPKRKDRKQMLIFDYLGSDVYYAEDDNSLPPKIQLVNTDIKLPGNLMVPWANRVNQLNEDEEYLALLADICIAQANRGHKVLLVSDRVSTISRLYQALHKNNKVIAITSKTKDRDEEIRLLREGKADILLGSIKIFAEGISESMLSCLVLGAAINNDVLLEQVIGRVTRKAEGKPQPLVVDICLSGATGKTQKLSRLGFYRSMGWDIEEATI